MRKRKKEREMWIVYRAWFVIFTWFVKQFFRISCFITDLSIECFFDEKTKEFFSCGIRSPSPTIQNSDELRIVYNDWIAAIHRSSLFHPIFQNSIFRGGSRVVYSRHIRYLLCLICNCVLMWTGSCKRLGKLFLTYHPANEH